MHTSDSVLMAVNAIPETDEEREHLRKLAFARDHAREMIRQVTNRVLAGEDDDRA